MSVKEGDTLSLVIERMGINGEGVAHFEGLTVFVDRTLPGEVVTAKIYEARKSFAKATPLSYQTTSVDRVEPICPLFGRCGGCHIMHLTYEKQLSFKTSRVIDALERIGKIPAPPVLSCKPSPLPLAYRNKIQLPFQNGSFGLYALHSHTLIPIDRCFIHSSLGEEVFACIQEIQKKHPLPQVVSHLLIKTAPETQQVLVIWVTRHREVPELLPFSHLLQKSHSAIRGIVQNIQKETTNTILGKETHLLAGKEWIEEKILGLTFRISTHSFFQVNPKQAEHVYETLLHYADLTGQEIVLDAYCGVGTLSLLLAKKAKHVLGVECVKEAIADAKENQKQNKIRNVAFHVDTTESFIQTLTHIDVAILNPPRKGCDRSVLEKLSFLDPKKILYLSCDPATLARDLSYLLEKGYQVEAVQPFDMFPQTAHVETVVYLSKKLSPPNTSI